LVARFHNPFAQGRLNDANNSRSGVLAVDWIAMPKFAMHLTHLLSQLTPEVTIYTHGNKDLAADLQARLAQSVGKASKVNVDNRRITRLELKSPQESTMQIHFDDETSTTECFLGHAAITTLNGSFAEQLGIDVSQSKAEYVVNGPTNMTNVEGVYAAGDATSMFKVWPNAVASGAVTAAGVAVRLQEEKWGLESIFG
jgi:thioredoxin reductase